MRTNSNQAYKLPQYAVNIRKSDPFKQDDDNDPTRIRPIKKEQPKTEPERIDPSIPEEEKVKHQGNQQVDPAIPEEKAFAGQ